MNEQPYDRVQEFQAYDAFPPEVRVAFANAIVNWSAAAARDHWNDPLIRAFELRKEETAHARIISDIQTSDEIERKRYRREMAHYARFGFARRANKALTNG